MSVHLKLGGLERRGKAELGNSSLAVWLWDLRPLSREQIATGGEGKQPWPLRCPFHPDSLPPGILGAREGGTASDTSSRKASVAPGGARSNNEGTEPRL